MLSFGEAVEVTEVKASIIVPESFTLWWEILSSPTYLLAWVWPDFCETMQVVKFWSENALFLKIRIQQ